MTHHFIIRKVSPNLWELRREAITIGYYNNHKRAVKAKKLITHIMAAADKKFKEIAKEGEL